jgi:hypothetical protein
MKNFRFKDEEQKEDLVVVNMQDSRIVVKFINQNGSKVEQDIALDQFKDILKMYKDLGFELTKDGQNA